MPKIVNINEQNNRKFAILIAAYIIGIKLFYGYDYYLKGFEAMAYRSCILLICPTKRNDIPAPNNIPPTTSSG